MASSTQISPKHSIKGFKFSNYKGIKSLEIDGLPLGASWIFLTGENGYGKTSVLQAIASTLWVQPNQNLLNYSQNHEGSLPNFEVDTHYQNFFLRFRKTGSYEMANNWLSIACYGSSRLDTYTEHSKTPSVSDLTSSLFDSTTLLANIEINLSRWYFKQNDREFFELYTNVSKLLSKLLSVKEIQIDKKTDQVLYVEKDQDGYHYEPLSSLELASGYRSLISMVGDMILRLLNNQPKTTNPSDLEGIVFIDELDLHFHPKWQKRLPGLLSELFPKVQFIASTHSPIPLIGAPEGSVFLRVNRNVKDGITIERLQDLEERIGDMLPNSVLTSPLFGFQDIFPTSHNPNKGIRTEYTYDEILVNDFVKERLSKYEGSEMEQALKDYIKDKKSGK